jgi:peroxiredoxin
MKSLFPILLISLIILSACNDKVVCTIDGKIAGLEDRTVYAVFENGERNRIDTVVCSKPGRFVIELKEDGFRQATLFFNDKTTWFTVYLDPQAKRIEVAGDMDYPSLFQAKGGQINNDLSALLRKMDDLLKEETDIHKSMNTNINSPAEGSELISRAANVKHQIKEHILDFIRENTANPASAVLIKNYIADPEDTRLLDELLISLDPELKDFYLISELEQYSIKAKRTALGAEAPDFTAKNIYGDTVSLNSYNKKYILLTFTAPWCDMCRTDELYLDEIDRKYGKDTLRQILVSLDDDIRGLREMLKGDSIRWNLIADSAGQSTMLLNLYNVNALPRCFLINEEGKIILKTENGVEVKQTLKKLLDHN